MTQAVMAVVWSERRDRIAPLPRKTAIIIAAQTFMQLFQKF